MRHQDRHARRRHDGPASKLWTGIVGLLIVGWLVRADAAGTSMSPESSVSAGRSMFLGESPLQGAIASHAELLPARTISCANCHLGAGLASAASFAPALNRSGMTQLSGRRGGPPSEFALASFCRMLRTGVDPASILITRRMPRYTLSDDQCLDLWRYIMEGGDEPAKQEGWRSFAIPWCSAACLATAGSDRLGCRSRPPRVAGLGAWGNRPGQATGQGARHQRRLERRLSRSAA
jgi:hypothetical protein